MVLIPRSRLKVLAVIPSSCTLGSRFFAQKLRKMLRQNKIMQVIIWFLVAIVVGSYVATPLADPDLWWHVVVGRWILAHGAVPQVDYWNMFGVGKPWRAYSWSNEVVYALFDNWRGFKGLLEAQIVLAVLMALSFMWSFGRIAKDYFWGGVLGILATLAVFSHFSLRPQVVTWILLALLLAVLNDRNLHKAAVGKAAIVSIFCLWANSHVTAPLGLLVLFIWALVEGWRYAFGLLLFGFLGTLITPYFGKEWLSLIEQSTHPAAYSFIAEFQPASILQYATGFLIIIAAVFSIFAYRRPAALHPAKYVAVGVFLIMALAVVKFLPFAVIIFCALLAEMWAREGWFAFGKLAIAIRGLNDAWRWLPAPGLAFFLISLGSVNVFNVWHSEPNNLSLPVRAVGFVREKNLPGPFLIGFGDAGYLMYQLAKSDGTTETLVPIDGRTNVTPPEVMNKYREAANGREGWREYFELVKPKTVIWRRESPLINILRLTSEWSEVYKDGILNDGYVVFFRE